MGRGFDVCCNDAAAHPPDASDATATRVLGAGAAQDAETPDATTNAGSPEWSEATKPALLLEIPQARSVRLLQRPLLIG